MLALLLALGAILIIVGARGLAIRLVALGGALLFLGPLLLTWIEVHTLGIVLLVLLATVPFGIVRFLEDRQTARNLLPKKQTSLKRRIDGE